MNGKLIGEKFIRLTRRDGFRKALQLAILYLRPRTTIHPEDDDKFDAAHGTETGGRVPLWNFRIDSPNARFGVRYEATDVRVLDQAVKFIGEDPKGLTFIDVGCGKGRVLLLAWEMGFKKVVGVEFAPELAKIAEANLKKAKASNAFVINADAAQFHFPDEDCVVYLFNPFSAEVMRNVVEHLRLAQSARRFVIYNSPYCAELFDSSGFLRRVGYVPETQNPTLVWALATSKNFTNVDRPAHTQP